MVSCALWFDFIECFMTTFLRAHSWLNWVDEDDDEDEVGLKDDVGLIIIITHRPKPISDIYSLSLARVGDSE